jgi:hypothetical protein
MTYNANPKPADQATGCQRGEGRRPSRNSSRKVKGRMVAGIQIQSASQRAISIPSSNPLLQAASGRRRRR